MGPNYGKAPRIYNWSFTIQHEIKKFLLEDGLRRQSLAWAEFSRSS